MPTTALPPIAKRYAKALCHLNHARRTQRLGLILGAGVSDDLKIPRWKDLIGMLERQLNYDSGGAPESYRAEQLFQHYRKKKTDELGWPIDEKLDAAITAGWREVVAKCLYKNFCASNGKLDMNAYKEKIKQHPYLSRLGKLAQEAQLVVSHNFDDALEVAIDLDPSISAPPNRRYHSFWRPEPFLRRGMVNIYHPNGFTPMRPGVRGSESLVLTEASFADHLANTNTEEAHFLLRHLADKTCLIIGHSLADGTLKNALRQHANLRPAHVNYYLHWSRRGEVSLSNSQKDAIREANFETYNLVTMFVDSSDIAEILRIVSMGEDELEGFLAHNSMVSRYVYYIVGAVSAGKSTTLRHLRDLATIEEWPSNMPIVMNRPSIGLKKVQEKSIDEQLEDAIWIKNCEIRNIKTGVVAVDRAPLDFIAFPTKGNESLGTTARKRGSAVLERLEISKLRDLCPGQVVVLQTEIEVLLARQLQRGGRTKPAEVADGSAGRYLERQQERLSTIYKVAIDAGSVAKTDRCSIALSVKSVARIIHFGDYRPFDFSKRLRAIRKGK
jgi:hypothetical protein